MASNEPTEDVRAIEAIIARQFRSLSWTPEAPADWEAFAGDFLPGAALYPAARPAERRTVEAFVERMRGLAAGQLRSLQETVLGREIRVFGNVAVAVVACGMVENGTETGRSVEMLLLVKTEKAWRIVAQAWDSEGALQPIPASLLGSPGGSSLAP